MAREAELITTSCDHLAPVQVRRRLAELSGLGWLLGEAMLVATELVTNAVRHSGCRPEDQLVVTVARRDGRVRVSVRDPGKSGRCARISDRPGSSGGLGLKIVDQLATEWGSQRNSDTYEVWAELPVDSSEATGREVRPAQRART